MQTHTHTQIQYTVTTPVNQWQPRVCVSAAEQTEEEVKLRSYANSLFSSLTEASSTIFSS